VDITEQFFAKIFDLHWGEKGAYLEGSSCSNRLSLVLVPNGPSPLSTIAPIARAGRISDAGPPGPKEKPLADTLISRGRNFASR
jgi:hypothetical protein